MQCLMKMSIAGLLVLSLSNCAGLRATDSFCQVYNKVVVAKGDGAITAKLDVKKRILANELTYRDQCKVGM